MSIRQQAPPLQGNLRAKFYYFIDELSVLLRKYADDVDFQKALKKSCEDLGFNVHVTEWRATENYLLDAAIKQEKGPNYRALNPYEDFRELKPSWSKGENWKIAQHMTKEDILASDVGRWLSTLSIKGQK